MPVIEAPAKLNLTLDVLGRRSDGYHEITSIMQAIDLSDTLTIAPADELTLTCEPSELAGPANLVWRTAMLLREAAGDSPRGARLHLRKRIPLAAGLGGGSSDAAAALIALDQLWDTHLSSQHLSEIAARLGSDVPYFLGGGTALAEGQGEQITPLPALAPAWAVIVVPPVSIAEKTRTLYGLLTAEDFGDGTRTRRLATALRQGERPAADLFGNAFERAVFGQFPEVDAARRQLLAAGAPWAHLTGSGPALYSIFAERQVAVATWQRLCRGGQTVYLAQTQ